MMRNVSILSLLMAAAVFVAQSAQGAIGVTNHSFELPDTNPLGDGNPDDEDGIQTFTPDGWNIVVEAGTSSGRGVATPADSHYGGTATVLDDLGVLTGGVFEGTQIGFFNLNDDGVSVARIDSDPVGKLAAGKTLTLTVGVGGRNTGSWRNINYSIGLVDEDGNELGAFASLIVDPGASATEVHDLTYTLDVSAQAAASIGKDYFIRIRGTNTGVGGTGGFTQANFDNVRLIPEPASLALLGLGGMMMLRRRRTK